MVNNPTEIAPVRIFVIDYDGADVLPGCLKSLADTIPPDIPVTIVDNASPIPSKSLVPDEIRTRCEIIRLEKNVGYAGAIAKAWDIADEDYIVICNNDLEFNSGWLEALLKTAQDERAHAVSAVIEHEDDTELQRTTNASLNPLMYMIEGVFRDRTVAVYPSGACFLLNKDPDLPIGPVDPSYFLYYEDVYIGFLLRALGKKVVQCPESRVRHAGSHSVKRSNPNHVAFYRERNRLVTMCLFLNWYSMLLIGPLIWLESAVKPFTCLFRGVPYWATVRAHWWLLFNCFSVLGKHVMLRKLPDFDASRIYPYLSGKIVPDHLPTAALQNWSSRIWFRTALMDVDRIAEEGET